MPRIKQTKPAVTFLVQQAMTQLDDFVNMNQLRFLTGASTNQVSAALYHLKKYGVVDCLESEGALWWFLTGNDSRQLVKEEVTVEEKPRRPRRTRKAPKA